MNNKVSVGVTSIVGWATAFLALVPTIISSVESGAVAFNGPEKYLAIFGIASGLITNIARYLQAHKLIGATIDGVNVGNTVNELDSSTVKNIINGVVSLIEHPVSTLEDKNKDEELASDIDNIATGTPGPPDADNSKISISPPVTPVQS